MRITLSLKLLKFSASSVKKRHNNKTWVELHNEGQNTFVKVVH